MIGKDIGTGNKQECLRSQLEGGCPSECPGVADSESIMGYAAGVTIQVCSNVLNAGKPPSVPDLNEGGPSIVTLYRTPSLSPGEAGDIFDCFAQ